MSLKAACACFKRTANQCENHEHVYSPFSSHEMYKKSQESFKNQTYIVEEEHVSHELLTLEIANLEWDDQASGDFVAPQEEWYIADLKDEVLRDLVEAPHEDVDDESRYEDYIEYNMFPLVPKEASSVQLYEKDI